MLYIPVPIQGGKPKPNCTALVPHLYRRAGRQLFDATMFRLIWGPAVNAMCAIVDCVSNEQLVTTALDGLQVRGAARWSDARPARSCA